MEVLNRSRMVFNYAIRNEANMRLFETMACGAAPLVEEGNQEVSILLKEGVHYLGYPAGGREAAGRPAGAAGTDRRGRGGGAAGCGALYQSEAIGISAGYGLP